MDSLTSEQLLAALRMAQWSADEVEQLREWVAGIRDPAAAASIAAATPAGCNGFAAVAAGAVTTR